MFSAELDLYCDYDPAFDLVSWRKGQPQPCHRGALYWSSGLTDKSWKIPSAAAWANSDACKELGPYEQRGGVSLATMSKKVKVSVFLLPRIIVWVHSMWERSISGAGRVLLEEVHHEPHLFLSVTKLHSSLPWRTALYSAAGCRNCNPQCFRISVVLVVVASEVPGLAKLLALTEWTQMKVTELESFSLIPLWKIALGWK